jgi:hypothetical protein
MGKEDCCVGLGVGTSAVDHGRVLEGNDLSGLK